MTEPDSSPGSRPPSRVVELLARENLLIALGAAFAALLGLIVRDLMVADSWMTLMAGREIVEHGLPDREVLTVIPRGREWIDQQWLAQVVFYGAERLGGLRLALGLNIALQLAAVAGAWVFARLRGASSRSTLFVAAPCLLVAPWAWQLRAQSLAVPLFVAVLGLLALDPRLTRRRTLLVLPLLVVWANVHGSVVLGAALVVVAVACALAVRPLDRLRHREPDPARPGTHPTLAIALGVGACLATLLSPYATGLPGYYRTVLIDSPIADVVTEWQAPTPSGWDLLFFVVAALTVVIAIWQRRRLSAFDLAVLAITLAGGLRSTRGIVWFAFAVMTLLPLAVDGLTKGDRGPVRRSAGPVVAGVSVVVAAAAIALGLADADRPRPANWPPAALAAVARERPTRLLATERFANWLLWSLPTLRGKVGYDIRFELLTADELAAVIRYKHAAPGGLRLADGYDVIVVDRRSTPTLTRALVREGATVEFRDDAIDVLRRPPGA